MMIAFGLNKTPNEPCSTVAEACGCRMVPNPRKGSESGCRGD
jgi:hypothetical protein